MSFDTSTLSHLCSHCGVDIVSFDSRVTNEFTCVDERKSVEEVSCVVRDM